MSVHRNHTLRLDKMQKRKFYAYVCLIFYLYKYIYIYNIGRKSLKTGLHYKYLIIK